MQIESATISLTGYREDNQDRATTLASGDCAIAIVVDGMGGHADGALAAQTALDSIGAEFTALDLPVFDPRGFLRDAIGNAHNAVVELGASLPVEHRPRATCAVALIQNGYAYWGHVGDSRVYFLRNMKVFKRTRDHSHVEILLQEGLITLEESIDHPLRNYVEICLGGDNEMPQFDVAGAIELDRGDVLLVCSDGLWGPLNDDTIGGFFHGGFPDLGLEANLKRLGDEAVSAAAPTSDNTSAAVIHWLAR